MRDIFICHAGEDKDEIVRPMVEAFNAANISCWYDEAEIRWGDSIIQKVNEGLASASYVVVVISQSFVQKPWPEREFNAVLNQEASIGEVKVLPLIVGSEEEKRNILDRYPLINDKRYLPWDGNLRSIVNELLLRLGRRATTAPGKSSATSTALGIHIPLPKITKKFTQRDKDLFLRNAFSIIKQYFQEALQRLSESYKEVETDFLEIHNYKFVATIYVRGETKSRCKIWIGGMSSSDCVAYQAGQFTLDGDNAYNDLLSVANDKQTLGFRPLGFGYSAYNSKVLTAETGAEYLWIKFTESIG
jgi:hypothetical protein